MSTTFESGLFGSAAIWKIIVTPNFGSASGLSGLMRGLNTNGNDALNSGVTTLHGLTFFSSAILCVSYFVRITVFVCFAVLSAYENLYEVAERSTHQPSDIRFNFIPEAVPARCSLAGEHLHLGFHWVCPLDPFSDTFRLRTVPPALLSADRTPAVRLCGDPWMPFRAH